MMSEKIEKAANVTVRNPIFFALVSVCVLLVALLVYVVGFGAKADDVTQLGKENHELLTTINNCLQKGECGKANKAQSELFVQLMIASNWCSVSTAGLSFEVYETCITTIMPKVELPK